MVTQRGGRSSTLDIPKKATLRLELVLCGKGKCTKLHGPYWYAYWQNGSRTRKVYVGKTLPPEVRARRLAPSRHKRGSAHDARVVEEFTLESPGRRSRT